MRQDRIWIGLKDTIQGQVTNPAPKFLRRWVAFESVVSGSSVTCHLAGCTMIGIFM